MQKFLLGTATVVMLLLLAGVVQANVLNVPGDYPSIAAALEFVSTNDTVLVGPGVYPGADYAGSSGGPQNVTLLGSGWPGGTILIDSEMGPVSNVFYLQDVHGWRITNFEMTWADYGLRLTNTSGVEVDHNFIHDVLGDPGWGCPVTACGDIVDMNIHHNLMARCHAGVYIGWEGWTGVTQNVRIVNNTIDFIWGTWMDAIQFRAVTPTGSRIVNNVIRVAPGQGVEFAICEQNDTEVSYNCIWQTESPWGNMQPGPGNILANPLYARMGGFPEYFFPAAESPCVDAGHPQSPPDPDGSTADIGAFYYDHATTLPPQPINDLRIRRTDDHMRLMWSPITHDTQGNPVAVSQYAIFASEEPFTESEGDLQGYVPGAATMYVDSNAVEDVHRFYNVRGEVQGQAVHRQNLRKR